MEPAAVGIILILLALIVIFVIGYILNIVKFFKQAKSNTSADSMFFARIVGIFIVPIGGVLGFF